MSSTVVRVCLFLSGFASLVYEVCWIRRGALTFGSTTLATSTVVAVLFAGLALGSHVFGLRSRRLENPMRWYAAVELGVGALGLASLALFPLADRAYGAAYRALQGSPGWLLLARACLVSAVLLPAATLMGATLPLVCARSAGRPAREAAGSAGVFYALNTLGAAAGCAATGFFLIPRIGLSRAIVLAALTNLAAAILAATVSSPASPAASAPLPRSAPGRGRLGLVSCIFFLSGFVALAHEVLWTRYLALLIRNTVYTYTLSLTVVLAGIVLGSLLAARLAGSVQASALSLGALQVLTGLYVLAVILLPPAAWQKLGPGPGVFFLAFLPPAVFSGASFPLAMRLVVEDSSALGYDVGRMSAVNILGGILGSLLMGFVGIPRLGLETSVLTTTALSLAAGLGAWLLATGGRMTRAALAAAALLLWLGIPRALETRIPGDFLSGDGVLLDLREGATANVAVVRTSDSTQLKIDRWWQGQDRKNHQIMAAHVPMLLHPNPRSVLVVGAGTGQTASRFLLYPVERLDVVDIEPAVFDLIRGHFDSGWLDDPRVRLLREDGRNHVAHASSTYDIVSLEVGQLFRPGVASFYTAEFYERVRARLSPGGVVSQFVPIPFLTLEEFRSLVGTFLDAFPRSVLWYNTSELLLLGSPDAPLTLHESRLDLLASDSAIRRDLEYSPWGGAEEWLQKRPAFLAGYLCGSESLRELTRGAPRSDDDRPVLEYATSGADEARNTDVEILASLRKRLDPIAALVDFRLPPAEAAAVLALRDRNVADMEASVWIRQAERRIAARRFEEAAGMLERAIPMNPRSVLARRLLGDVLTELGRYAQAHDHFDAALAIAPGDVPTLRGLAAWQLAQGRHDEARSLYEKLLGIRPDDAEAHYNLGVLLARAGDLAAAVVQLREALRWNPGDADAQRSLAWAEAALRERGLAAPGPAQQQR